MPWNSNATDDLAAALKRLIDDAPDAAREASKSMGTVGERAIKLELSRSSHARGTKTPSRPFADPPSLISGRLRESVRRTRVWSSGSQYGVNVAPTTVYARIQELGGVAGRGHKTRLPPRPYVRPALKRWAEKYRNAAVRAFGDETGLR
jgi:phage gpG-like protein